MRWLVTVRANSDLNLVARELRRRGCDLPPLQGGIPMAEGDSVIVCEGPANLPETARAIPGVVKVSPSSELTIY